MKVLTCLLLLFGFNSCYSDDCVDMIVGDGHLNITQPNDCEEGGVDWHYTGMGGNSYITTDISREDKADFELCLSTKSQFDITASVQDADGNWQNKQFGDDEGEGGDCMMSNNGILKMRFQCPTIYYVVWITWNTKHCTK